MDTTPENVWKEAVGGVCGKTEVLEIKDAHGCLLKVELLHVNENFGMGPHTGFRRRCSYGGSFSMGKLRFTGVDKKTHESALEEALEAAEKHLLAGIEELQKAGHPSPHLTVEMLTAAINAAREKLGLPPKLEEDIGATANPRDVA